MLHNARGEGAEANAGLVGGREGGREGRRKGITKRNPTNGSFKEGGREGGRALILTLSPASTRLTSPTESRPLDFWKWV